MAQTLLQLCQQASREMGINAPATIISNTAQYPIQLLNLINGVGQELVREFQWQAITKLHTFQTVYYQYTGTTTDGSTTITGLSSTTGLTATPTYFNVLGQGISQNVSLVSVDSGASTCVISQAATVSGTTTLTFSQTMYNMPADYDRQVDRTHWDRSMRWELLGPQTAQQWEWLLSGYIATGPRIRYRILADKFQIWPPPAANDYLRFEYVGDFWVLASAATDPSKSAFAVDTDTCVFPDRLMIDGLKYRFAEAQSLARTPAYQASWTRQLNISKAADAGSQTLSMAPGPESVLINWWNIPDTGYGPD